MISSRFASLFSSRLTDATLGDGIHQCSLSQIPALLRSLDSFSPCRSLNSNTTIALQTTNSVPGAIVLLWLIWSNYRFYLVPPIQGNEPIWERIPSFCTFLLSIEDKNPGAFAPEEPLWNRFLSVEAAPNGLAEYDGTQQHPQGMLYLRTSGSIGKSKIVSYELENLLSQATNSARHYKLSPRDRVMIPVPIFHLYGLMRAFLSAMLAGASVEMQNNSNLIKYLARERQFRPTVAFLTPSLCEMLYKGKRDNTDYRLIVTGGQNIQQKLFKAFDRKFGGALVNSYGSSEMGVMTSSRPGEPVELKCQTVGKPLPGVELRVRTAQNGAEASATPKHEGGLLFVRHQFAFSGYVDDRGDFIERHERGQWFRTGDVGFVQDDGYLRIIGRADSQVNRSGYLVSLPEIESKIGDLPGVAAAVVLALDEEGPRGQTVVAVCVVDKQNPNSCVEQAASEVGNSKSVEAVSEGIQHACREVLRPYAVPDRVLVLPSIPRLPSGKIDRRGLKLMVEGQK